MRTIQHYLATNIKIEQKLMSYTVPCVGAAGGSRVALVGLLPALRPALGMDVSRRVSSLRKKWQFEEI